jgi:biopolymer transport protein ExbB/TolQ
MEFLPLIIVLITIAVCEWLVSVKVIGKIKEETLKLEQELAIALDQSAEQAKRIIGLVKNVQHTNREYQRMLDQRNDADSENARLQNLLNKERSRYNHFATRF